MRGASASDTARMGTTLHANRTLRPNKERIPHSFIGLPREETIHRASPQQTQEASGKLPRSQAHTRFCGRSGCELLLGVLVLDGEELDLEYQCCVGTDLTTSATLAIRQFSVNEELPL